MMIATAAVLAPASAAYAGQAGSDHGEHPCVVASDGETVVAGESFDDTIECPRPTEAVFGADAGTATDGGGTDGGGMVLAATGATSVPYLVIAGGLLVAGVATIFMQRVRPARQD